MRSTTGLLASASVGAVLAFGVCTGTAFAAAATTAPSAGPTAQEIGHLMLSPTPVAPGATVHISGTCPTPPPGAPQPVVQSVTSPGFAQLATLTKLDPMAFEGHTVVSPTVATGTYTVEAICSNGKAYALLPVNAPNPPAPAPAHHEGGGGAAGAQGGAGARSGSDRGDGGSGVIVTETQTEDTPAWPWIAGGVLLALGLGGAAYTIGRRSSSAAAQDAAFPQEVRDRRDPSVETSPIDRTRR